MTHDAPLAHQLRGSGPPVLLLNGIMMSLGAWGPFATRLEARCRVLRCDFRGQLLSPGPARPDLAAHALDIVDLLDRAGLERVHVAGTSFGGLVAQLLAARWPRRVASLALVAAGSRIDDALAAEADAWAAAAREVLAGGDRGVLFDLLLPKVYAPAYVAARAEEFAERRRLFAALPDEWFAGLLGLVAAVRAADTTALLGLIQCPALVVAGEIDRLVPPAAVQAVAQRLAARPGGCEYALVPGAAHGLVFEQPDRLASLYLDFVARHA